MCLCNVEVHQDAMKKLKATQHIAPAAVLCISLLGSTNYILESLILLLKHLKQRGLKSHTSSIFGRNKRKDIDSPKCSYFGPKRGELFFCRYPLCILYSSLCKISLTCFLISHTLIFLMAYFFINTV